MRERRRFSWDRPVLAVAFVMALVVAGCGGDTPAPAGKGDAAPATESTPSASASQKSVSTNPSKSMSPGGELGVRERRALKRKEKGASSP